MAEADFFNDLSMEDLETSFVDEGNENEEQSVQEDRSSLTDDTGEPIDEPGNDLKNEISDFKAKEGEEEESVADEEDGTTDDEPPSDSSEKYSLLASALLEEGVLPSLDEEKIKNIKSFSDIAEAVKEELRNNEYAGLNDAQKEYLKALDSGIPDSEFRSHKAKSADIEKITSEDLENNETLRFNLIKEDFLSKGYSEEKAEKLTQRSVELGEDLEDALEALEIKKNNIKEDFQKKVEAYQEKLKEQEKATQKQMETLKNIIFDEEKALIPWHKHNKQFAQKVYDTITKPAGQTEDGRSYNAIMKAKMENPVEFEYKISYLYNLTDGFKNFDNLIKTAKTESVKKLDQVLNEQTYSRNSGNAGSTMSDKKLNEALDNLDKFL